MSAINLARGFSSISILLLCFLIILFQVLMRLKMGIREKVLFLGVIFAMQIVILVFESWRIQNLEEEEEGQVSWGLPGYYGFNLMGRLQT